MNDFRPSQYRKREPIDVEAVQVTREAAEHIAAWCGGRLVNPHPEDESEVFHGIKLRTRRRLQVAIAGEYIVRDPQDGLFDVVGPFTFEYEFELIKQDNKEQKNGS